MQYNDAEKVMSKLESRFPGDEPAIVSVPLSSDNPSGAERDYQVRLPEFGMALDATIAVELAEMAKDVDAQLSIAADGGALGTSLSALFT